MKAKYFLALLALTASTMFAQNDPTIMTINGKAIPKSEFEYSFRKNNSQGVIDKKSVKDYVDLFINYKLKVLAAMDAGLDTTTAFRKEFAQYRDQQIRPAMITDADVEREAYRIYRQKQQQVDNNGGLVKASHILIMLKQQATDAEKDKAKIRIDSIYQAIKGGADFSEMARRLSDDKGSAQQGGELPWLEHGQTLKEFDDVVYSLKKGELSKPFLSPVGYHVVLLKDKRNFFAYDSLKANILSFIENRGIKEQIIDQKLDSLSKASNGQSTPETLLTAKLQELEEQDPSLKYLIQEYHDGLLLFDISDRMVWKKATDDVDGQQEYFRKNKKRYKWDAPRYKGIAYYTKEESDIKAVRNAIKKVPFDKWAETLKTTFNNDSTIRIRVEKGIFKQGDNALVDREVFKKDTTVTAPQGYPHQAVYGKKLKAPKEYTDVKAQVIADYQEDLEKAWVESLRKRYEVKVDEAVLSTVE